MQRRSHVPTPTSPHLQAFAVRHFAGDVCYFGESFCEKNNDTLHSDFTDQMAASPHAILSKLFVSDGTTKKGNTFNSVSRRFINDLNALMTDLNATKAHFIRCIKPNTVLKPSVFTPVLVSPLDSNRIAHVTPSPLPPSAVAVIWFALIGPDHMDQIRTDEMRSDQTRPH